MTGSLSDAFARIEADIARAATRAVRKVTTGLKDDLRDQIRIAGLGNKLATSWRGDVFPKSGNSMSAAGFVSSKAPRIIAGFDRGDSIVPKASPYLAIPTENVPRRLGGRGAKARMSVAEVEAQFNQDLTILPGKRGNKLGFVRVIRARSSRRAGFRAPTVGRTLQGRKVELVLMFIFAKRVTQPKLLDVRAAANRWAARLPGAFAAEMQTIRGAG